MHMLQSLFYLTIALHVSGIIITHLQEHKTTVTTVLIRPRWKEVAVPVLWPIPDVAVTVFSAPDDGCFDTRNM